MHFLKKLKQFQVDENILIGFYQTIIRSAKLYNQVCYFGNSKKAGTERLNKVARTVAKIVGTELVVLSTNYGNVAVKKLHRILLDTKHPLSHVLSSYKSPGVTVPNGCGVSRPGPTDSGTPSYRQVRLHNSSV